MSLFKQLWIGLAILMISVFGATFYINAEGSRAYLEQALTLKNQDDALREARLLRERLLEPDIVSIELELQTIIDQGNYERVEFFDPDGHLLVALSNTPPISDAPEQFIQMFPIDAQPGRNLVDNGWTQLGSISVQSWASFSYDELWTGAQRTLMMLLVALLITGLVSTGLLMKILKPLDQVVDQATAIGERRFLTVPLPWTKEFAQVTQSMNDLSRRVQDMLERETRRLASQREAQDVDPVTGLLLREPFMNRLLATLESESENAAGSVVILRINNLLKLNQLYGRAAIDHLLQEIGQALKAAVPAREAWVIGRLNGSDIAVIAPQEISPKPIAERLLKALIAVIEAHELLQETTLPAACIYYESGDTLGQMMTTLDSALLLADKEASNLIIEANRSDATQGSAREQALYWRQSLQNAFDHGDVSIVTFPVVDEQGLLIHDEAMVRIHINNQIRHAGEFLPWVHRLDMSDALDREVIRLCIDRIKTSGRSVHANLSTNAVTNSNFATWLSDLIKGEPEAQGWLGLEVSEATAFTHPEGFRKLCQSVKPYRIKIGIEHMGYRISDIGKLGDLGPDYLKIDSLFTREISQNSGNQALVRTYAGIAQSLGIPCIAEGVATSGDWIAVTELGAVGATGRGVKESE